MVKFKSLLNDIIEIGYETSELDAVIERAIDFANEKVQESLAIEDIIIKTLPFLRDMVYEHAKTYVFGVLDQSKKMKN
ncbi:MAG: hypothetical protein WBZ20_12355 [Nitrososphaeraceae archaeon]